MPKITINLLPEEFRLEELKRAKFYRVQTIGVGIIMLFIFLSTLTIALRILQSQSIKQVQAKLNTEKEKITNLKTTQGSILLLKNRLTAINQFLGISSKQVLTYEFINRILPSSVNISSISVNKSGDISLLLDSPDSSSVDELISNLTTGEEAQAKIVNVAIEGLNRGRDGVFRLSLKITTKG